MLSRTSHYALRAMLYLADHKQDWPLPSQRIAAGAGVPATYLSAILRQLVRGGVLHSVPGPGGGFSLAREPEQITLHDVLAPFEDCQQDARVCPFGNDVCSEVNPCRGHDRWKLVKLAFDDFLNHTSILDVSAPLKPPTRVRATRRKK
jgi:Rrf2 family protein